MGGPPSWYGSLITGQIDASGMLYRRNRYVDPATGKFTEADPIGLAGGLNLFGYVGGDPVNFSDPLGLCCTAVGAEIGGAILDIPGAVIGGIVGGAIGWVGGMIVGHLWNEAADAENSKGEGERVWNDPGSLKGATPEEVAQTIPEGWVKSPSKKGGGTRWSNPKAQGQQVRVMPGNPADPDVLKQGPYGVVSTGEGPPVKFPMKGNNVLGGGHE